MAVPFRLAFGEGILDFISTPTVFGTPVDITLLELAIQTFFPPMPRRRPRSDVAPRRAPGGTPGLLAGA